MPVLDVVIREGMVVDGTGNPWLRADVGIRDGRITLIGNADHMEAEKRIDVDGLVVCPGFIDIHTHSDFSTFRGPQVERKVRQGVTTELIGHCGISAAPLVKESREDLERFFSGWRLGVKETVPDRLTVEEYLEGLERRGVGLNVATLIGHTIVRIDVMGFEARSPSDRELEWMKELVEQGMEEGAFGLSTGLFEIAPANYSTTEELVELCRVVAKFGGVHHCHRRSVYPSSIDEVVEITERSGAPGHIAHLGGADMESVRKVEEARARGLDITFDQYPYTAGMVYLKGFLPESLQAGGVEEIIGRLSRPEIREAVKRRDESIVWELASTLDWSKVVVVYCRKNKPLQGKSLQEIAESRQVDPVDALFDLFIEERGEAMAIGFGRRTEEDVLRTFKRPLSMLGSDSAEAPYDRHPRVAGSHAKVLGRYVREKRALTLEEAIRKMTSFPAQRMGLRDRGLLREGMWADVAIFDPSTIIDRSTYQNPEEYAEGVKYVFINGEAALDDGEMTPIFPGRVLRHRCPHL